MSWWERAYLFEIVRGLAITGGVFMRNMWRWITGRKGALTTYYPEETRADYARGQPRQARADAAAGRQAAVHRLQHVRDGVPGQGDRDRSAFDPDDAAHPKYPVRFEIDYSRCIFCGLCVEACPEDAIRMVKEVPDLPAFDREHMWLGSRGTAHWNPQSDVAKPYPPSAAARSASAEQGHDRHAAALPLRRHRALLPARC